jgi:bifunctional UDP-N-acetylglucosamine pyrophosphorylase/glucosamine-1-phosphate N-acetyltransferase
MKTNSVIILAAGNGSRMKSSISKVFHKVGGLSLLDHVIKSAKNTNPDKIVAVLKSTYPLDRLQYGSCISPAYQKKPDGTGDAVNCALDQIDCNNDGWVYILYADIPLVSSDTLTKLSETACNCAETGAVILAMELDNSKDLGKLEANDDGTIKRIVEAKDISNEGHFLALCNAGLFIRKKLLKKLIREIKPSNATGEIYITEIIRLIHENGFKCRYYKGNSDELLGINTMEELSILEKKFQENARKMHMANGVTLVAPETVFFFHDTEIESDVTVHPYVVFLGGVSIKSGAEILPFCTLEGAKIEKSKIGPFARIRAGTEVKENAKIGNFVEIKNSFISSNAKINHLSYIGDSHIGDGTNVGAGTITCNYDGFEKHKTNIGRNVFIGSNSSIVAPVEINDDAMIGAGSVITKNVEKESLAIARSLQENIKDGATNFKMKKNRK